MACSGCIKRTLWSGKSARAPCLPRLSWKRGGGLALSPPHAARSMLTFPNETERENVDGQEKADEKADIAGRGPHRRAKKIARAAEATHRHQSLSRRGFQSRWSARLRALPRSRHRGGQPRPGAGACDSADRAVQSGGGFKTAFPRRRVSDGLCPKRLGQNLHGRAGRT